MFSRKGFVCHLFPQPGKLGARVLRPFLFFAQNLRSHHIPRLIRQLLNADVTFTPLSESRKRFISDVTPFLRTIGVWMGMPVALYNEMHAHLIGDALPLKLGRFQASTIPRVADAAYREQVRVFWEVQRSQPH